MGFWTSSNPYSLESLATSVGLIQSNFTMLEGALGSSTLSAGITYAQGDILYAPAVQTVRTLAKASANASAIMTNWGVSNNPSWVATPMNNSFVSGLLGTWLDCSAAAAHDNELAATDGFVCAWGQRVPDGVSAYLYGYSDAASPPATVRGVWDIPAGGNEGAYFSIMFPVKKGHRWYIAHNNCTPTVWWLPIGA